MNLAHVLSWGSSVSSLGSIENISGSISGSSSSSRELLDGVWHQRPHSRWPQQLTISCRGNFDANSNAVSNRPRGPSEQNSNGNSNYRRGSGAGRSDGSNRHGGGNSRSGSGGYNRGRGNRRDREPKMHPGAYKMRDEQTGEMVVVWGVETDEDIPMPTAADLNWRKSTTALPGDASEENWAKVFEEQTRSDGSFRVRGEEPGGKDWSESLYEEDPEDDYEEDAFSDDEDDTDLDTEDAEERPRMAVSSAVSRAPRVRVFGRDVFGKSQPEGKVTENNDTDVTSERTSNRKSVPSTDVLQAIAQNMDALVGDHSSQYSGQSPLPLDPAGKSTETDGNVPPKFEQELRKANLDGDDYLATSWKSPNEDEGSVEGRATARGEKEIAERRRDTESDTNSRQRSLAEQVEDEGIERYGVGRSDYEAAESRVGRNKDKPVDGRGKSSKKDIQVKEEPEVTTSGSFNPYILDISEEGDNRKQQKDVRKSGLLDRLRSQALGVQPKSESPEELLAPRRESLKDDRGSLIEDSIKDSAVPAMRDLTDRDNYDASIANDFFSSKSFKELGATPDVIQALSYYNVKRPSQIQAMAYKPILDGKSCIIAEQTGSGKTLAYVAPLLQRLKADEARSMGKPLSKKPRILVLAPTGELASQVLGNFRALSKGGLPCRSIVITGGFKWKTQVESLAMGADVVVATPGRLLQQLDAGNINFDNLKSVVLDEVDILFDDEDFSKALETINKAASIKVQYIHVTATLPVDIHDDLLERYPDCVPIMGPSLHRTAIGLQEVLVDCSGGEADDKTPDSAFANKRKALLQLVEERPVAKTIIFCNKVETCRKVENVLSRFDRSGKNIRVLPYHAALSQEIRLESMETFIKSHPKERLFLVCTDRASRGIDSLDVEHVVLFDFPRDPSEYVRRVGRTARGAGGTGKVFAFVVGRQVGHARRIMARNDKGEPVHDVPGQRYYYRN